jgi:hypothetical protein
LYEHTPEAVEARQRRDAGSGARGTIDRPPSVQVL